MVEIKVNERWVLLRKGTRALVSSEQQVQQVNSLNQVFSCHGTNLPFPPAATPRREFELPPSSSGIVANRLASEDRAVHDWYRFVLSYPPHLVRGYLDKFEVTPSMTVLDPFCGTGTTLVECKKRGVASVGIEANSMAHFASATKVDWDVEASNLLEAAERVADWAEDYLQEDAAFQLRELPPDSQRIILTNSISPLPLHKALVLLEGIEESEHKKFEPYFKIALASALVGPIGNLRFGPEVGVSKKLKTDAPVIESWLENVRAIARDLEEFRDLADVPTRVHHADARVLPTLLKPNSVDAVITSPPYPNEKDYTRTTRLESVMLGFLNSPMELRALKKSLLRSNTRNVYKGDDDDQWIADHGEIQRLAAEIETRRIEMGKTSGFEKLYHKVTKLYFGGMARHLSALQSVLKPGARLAYVVGDQASYLRVMIRTGQLLAQIAEDLGYEVVSVDLFRTRVSTVTGEQLREEVVILRWLGEPKTGEPK